MSALCRDEFILPRNDQVGAKLVPASEPCIYLCGNSLGPLAKKSKDLVYREIDVWANRAVLAHHDHPHFKPGWLEIADQVHPLLATIVGAKENEVACMGTLTANLHLMMSSFYKPTKERYKILCEAKAFPSDQYAFVSQVLLHDLDPLTAIIQMSPRQDEHCLREQDILDTIESKGSDIALVIFSGVQFYTGQWFPMENITAAAQKKGCIVGWDLAHAVGNVPLQLHDWQVDFAVWCTYKYLNSGPGGIGGLFVHEKWDKKQMPKMAGWWGHDLQSRFEMPSEFKPIKGAHGFQQSNPCVLASIALLGSLQVFEQAGGINAVRRRSIELTAYLESLLRASDYYLDGTKTGPGFTIITPKEAASRGAQLSLLFYPLGSQLMQRVFHGIRERGVIGDERNPDVIRLAPVALFNTFEECKRAVTAIEQVLAEIN